MQQNQVMEAPGGQDGKQGFRKNFGFYLERNEEPLTGFEERCDLKK